MSAPTIAPRIGPDARSHVIGGPACSSRLSRMPGMTSRAGATVRRIGRAAIMRPTAVSLAWSMSITFHPRQNTHQLLVASGRRAPRHLHGGCALPLQAVVKGLQPDVDRRQLVLEIDQR